ncbi:MAG: rhodanese family protein [Aquisalinus sp.]|nr:rhodanese family protein [Aquisalinus sp.]
MTELKNMNVQNAAQLLAEDAIVLIDIREKDEYAREHIKGALSLPLSQLEGAKVDLHTNQAAVFHCRSGSRTQANCRKLDSIVEGEAYLLDGGIEAWKKTGLPVITDTSAPIEIMRQVQITAGSLVLLGLVLGTFVDRNFLALSAFIGAGLVFAGVSGWCGMAAMLGAMPWNRSAKSAQ